MAWTDFLEHEPEFEGTFMAVPPGYHWRTRFHIKGTLRGRHRLPYSLSAHDKARQIGPVPLPFKQRRQRWARR